MSTKENDIWNENLEEHKREWEKEFAQLLITSIRAGGALELGKEGERGYIHMDRIVDFIRQELTSQKASLIEEALAEDNGRLRKAGCELAEAAIYTIREYDGLHRLALAVGKWAEAVANESGRGNAEAPELINK